MRLYVAFLLVCAVYSPAQEQRPPAPKEKEAAQVTLRGQLVDGGIVCPRFRADDGKHYNLMGNIGKFHSGDRVEITAKPAGASHCMQDTPLEVTKIRRL